MTALLELYRFISSYLLISVEGGFTERFLNLCSREKIYLWDVAFENKSVKAKMYCRDFHRLKSIRKKCGVKIKIAEKHGLKFTLKALKKRKVLLSGMICALIFMYLMNQFVWFIDVNGNEKLNKAELISTAEALGLKQGTLVPLFDKNTAGRELVNRSDGKLLWASVNIKGSRAVIELREYNEIKSATLENNNPCNIIADFDGVIISNETYEGFSCTSKGNAVKKGDILISGISENADGSVNFHSADGKLSAYHKAALNYSVKRKEEIHRLKNSDSFSVVNIFSASIPLSLKAFKAYKDRYEYDKAICIDGHIFPFGITNKSNTEKVSEINSKISLLTAIDDFTEFEYTSMKNSRIISTDYVISTESDCYKISAEYECIDFIGKKTDILKEN